MILTDEVIPMGEKDGRHVIKKEDEIAKPKKKRIGLRILIGVLCALLLIVVGGVLFVNAKLNRMQRTAGTADATPAPEEIVSTAGNEAKIDLEKLEQR